MKIGLLVCCIMLLLSSKFDANRLKHTQVIASGVKKKEKKQKMEEKYEEIRQILKAHISVMARRIQLKFRIGGSLL